ncbi:MAG TPA: type II secretion system protein [Candidatus Saccharimonadia bacterium]|nr:type II secretion system protein [Candidatus Saccharimonadia bacterium]
MKNFSRLLKKHAGFTLLELLVVISLIGILVALGTVSYTTAQQKARNAKRRGDMKAWAAALEQYNADHSSQYIASCNPGSPYLTTGAVPTDPKPPAAYTSSCTTSAFCICAALEPNTSTDGNSSAVADATCTGLSGSGAYFCVKSQQ